MAKGPMNTDPDQQQKQRTHALIDRLARQKLTAVVGILEALLDPFDRALANAEIDDEPVTEEDLGDVEAFLEWLRHNTGIPFEHVVAELGLT
jgi:hypothetical protein